VIFGAIFLIVTHSLIGYFVMVIGAVVGFLGFIVKEALEKLKHRKT
jgi:hypothetical protein